MSQSTPAVLFHGQALKLLTDLNAAYQQGIGRVDDLVGRLREALASFENSVGAPLLEFDPVSEGEPPLSSKINRLWDNMSSDINLLQRQVDVARAATIFSHNMIRNELTAVQLANARVANKLKTLQLYSKAVDSSVVVFGDYFRSEEFLDMKKVPEYQQTMLPGDGYITLAPSGDLEQLTDIADVYIAPSSNGFLGNLHEIATVNAESGIVFKAESAPRRNLGDLVDAEPNTWIEYEHWLVSEGDRLHAGNRGFTYQRETDAGVTEYIDWGVGPPGGVLRLVMDFDLRGVHAMNFISIVPFNLEDNINYPIKIAKIETSRDGTDWEGVFPQNIYIGSAINIQAARVASDIVIGEAIWAFAGRVCRYIRFVFEQSHSLTREMGHIYHIDKAGNRVDTPAPPEADPTSIYLGSKMSSGEFSQQREMFVAERWAIGLRDITISHINYLQEGVAITQPLRVGGVVDRVSLEAEISIPPEYDNSEGWVSFFISPDDGVSWFQISRVQDDFLGIPEILAFNDPLPTQFHESGVAYYNVPGAVTTLRLKVVLHRPPDLPATTPVLHSYQLKVRRR